jgi:hypothetical protein
MRIASLFISCALLTAGCHPRSSQRLRTLVGEVHIHGFAGGVHPAALFVKSPVAAAQVDGDSIVDERSDATGESCVSVSSATFAAPRFDMIDAGHLRIKGGTGIRDVELAFDKQAGYLPVTELPHHELFTGGERLTIETDGHAALPFAGALEAPTRLEITEPANLSLTQTGLTVRWKPDHAERVKLALVVSRRDGRWVVVRCKAADAAGQFTFPAELLAGLPEPPRDLQLEVTRNQMVRVATAVEGTGVILHASFASKLDAHEER